MWTFRCLKCGALSPGVPTCCSADDDWEVVRVTPDPDTLPPKIVDVQYAQVEGSSWEGYFVQVLGIDSKFVEVMVVRGPRSQLGRKFRVRRRSVRPWNAELPKNDIADRLLQPPPQLTKEQLVRLNRVVYGDPDG